MDKDNWVFTALIGIGTAFAVFVGYDEYTRVKTFAENCEAAGGVPSRTEAVSGKTRHMHRVCLHPSAIIELKE